MNGYILIDKNIVESEIWDKPPMYLKVWIYLIQQAQWKDYKNLKRGQLITSIDKIREACSHHIGYRKITPTKKEIWGIVNFFRNSNEGNNGGNNERDMVVTTKVTGGMLITICNYNIYQDPNNYESNNEKDTEVTTKSQRKGKQGNNKNEEYKNNNNKEKEKYKKEKESVEQLPPKLRKAVYEFIEYRKEIGKPYKSDRGLDMMIKKLSELSGGDEDTAVKILEQSMANTWQGIFTLQESTSNRKNEFFDLVREMEQKQ